MQDTEIEIFDQTDVILAIILKEKRHVEMLCTPKNHIRDKASSLIDRIKVCSQHPQDPARRVW
jgi:hypothetical protein